MTEVSPIPDFLQAFGEGPDRMAAFLAEEVVFTAGDLPAVKGRWAVLRLWRRLFQTYASIEMQLVRHVPDGDLVVVEQRQGFTPKGRDGLRFDSIVIYSLKDGLITGWADHLELGAMPGEEQALWRRLWAADW